MKKFILIFVLAVLLISFAAAFYLFAGKLKTGQPSPVQPLATEFGENTVPEANTDRGISVYEDYSAEIYEKALTEDRVVVLYFTANWCEICRTQEEINTKVFSGLTTDGVVALRIHILDSEATIDTENLAKKFSIAKENTSVILNSDTGAIVYKFTGLLEDGALIEKIIEARQKDE